MSTVQYKPGDVANGHVLTSDGEWVPQPAQVAKPSSTAAYKPGDVANGHVLTSQGQWVPQQAAYIPARKNGMPTWLKVVIALFAAGLVLTVAVVACTAAVVGGAAKSVDDAGKPGKTAVPLHSPGKAGELTFTVDKVEFTSKVPGFLSGPAQGRFALVTVTVKNTSTQPKTAWTSEQNLFDTKGAKFSASDEATIDANDNGNAADPWNTEVNPGNSFTAVLVYDVPKGDALSTLVVHDGLTSTGKATMALG